MNPKQIIGAVLLVVGVLLIFFGFQSSQGWDDQISQTVTGEFTDSTLWYWIGGAAAAVIGLVLVAMKR
ncbi:MAG: DUF3185 family protein [Wenzhouxiangella sp.]